MKKSVLSCIFTLFLLTGTAFAADNYDFAIKPEYQYASAFTEDGLAYVVDENNTPGVINMKGERVFGFDGTQFAIRKNGLIMALGENEKAAFFDKTGKQVTEYSYDVLKRTEPKAPQETVYMLNSQYDGDGKSDLIPVSIDQKFGCINSRGELVIPLEHDFIFGFRNGISKIGALGYLSEFGMYLECKYGYINESGEILYSADSLWEAGDFYECDYAEINDGEYKIIDNTGKPVNLGIGNYHFWEIKNGLILAHDGNDRTAVFNTDGQLLVPLSYTKKSLFRKSIIIDDKKLISQSGEILYEAPEDTVIMGDIFSDNTNLRTIVKSNEDTPHAEGMINSEGEVVFPAEYPSLWNMGDGLVYAQNYNGQNVLYSDKGEKLLILNGDIQTAPSNGLIAVRDYDTMRYGYIKSPIIKPGEKAAEILYSLGLFKGVGENRNGTVNFALERPGTRTEAIVMLIRALGKDEEAVNYGKTHPFTDVAPWADGYISYAYNNGITKGVSADRFGSSDVTQTQYLTFMLRALGYNDAEGDFSYENPIEFAADMGITATDSVSFMRSDMANITYHTLYAHIKDTKTPLWQKLVKEGILQEGSLPNEKVKI